MKRAVVFAKAYPPTSGGVERYSFEVANVLKKKFDKVTVITQIASEPKGNSFKDNIEVLNVGSGNQLLVFIKMLVMAFKLRCSGVKPKFVLCTTWRMCFPAFVFKGSGAEFALSVHGNEVLKPGFFLRCLMVLAFRSVRRIVCVSRYTKHVFLSKFPKFKHKTYFSYNGLTQTLQDNAKRKNVDGLKVFTVCRLEPRKNIILAIDAVIKARGVLERQGIDLQYDIAGSGSDIDLVREKVRLERAEDFIHVHGRVSDKELDDLYRSSEVFLHPQYEDLLSGDVEGFGLVIADAMICGLVPVIGDNGGAQELLTDGGEGYKVDPFSVAQISERIIELGSNSDRLGCMSKRARERAYENFSWERHVCSLLKSNTVD